MTELDLLEKELTTAVSLRDEALTKGQVTGWDEYRYLVGVVSGLRAALDAVKNAKAKYQEA